MDRSITMVVTPGMPAEQYLPELHDEAMAFAGEQLSEWLNGEAEQAALKAAPALADVPGSARFRQIMAPLAAICGLAGITDEFQAAVRELQTGISSKPLPSRSEFLVMDLRDMWPEDDPLLRGADAIELLHQHSSGRWEKIPATRIGEIMLAGMLREQGVFSHASNGQRGYRREDLAAQSAVGSTVSAA
jgi:hypothetical protein